MREGTVYRRFKAKDGRDVTLRALRWSDLDDAVELINGLIGEGADVVMDTPVSREDEARWIGGRMTSQENDKHVSVVAEVGGNMVGNSDVTPLTGRERHVGRLGIVIKDGYRDIGIGSEMMRELEIQSLRLGLKILVLDVFSSNKRAIHVYEESGFGRVGVIPMGVKKSTGYADVITMYKHIAMNG